MFLGEPPPTQGEIHFRIFGIPVRIHPFFWLIALFMGLGGGGGTELAQLAIWMGVVFVSILTHELGHALVVRSYGAPTRITLYGLGGMASCPGNLKPLQHIAVSLAGPGAGFALAAMTIVAIKLSGNTVELRGYLLIPFGPIESSPLVREFLFQMLYVNIFWGLLNLLPVYPLDGGQVARELFLLFKVRDGIKYSLMLSVVVGGLLAAAAIIYGQRFFLAALLGYLAYSSYQTLERYSSHRRW